MSGKTDWMRYLVIFRVEHIVYGNYLLPENESRKLRFVIISGTVLWGESAAEGSNPPLSLAIYSGS